MIQPEPPPSRSVAPDSGQRTVVFRWRLTVVAVLWLLSVGVGIGLLWWHGQTEGELNTPPASWPAGSNLPRRPGAPALLMFAHPHCPCTIASLRELERLLAQSSQPLDAVVVFEQPDGTADDWTDTGSRALAEGIAGVTTFVDRGGAERERFAAATSGQVCLYGGDGQLLFHGGITAARGHEGGSVGRSAITALVGGDDAEACSAVYGCPLKTPSKQAGG